MKKILLGIGMLAGVFMFAGCNIQSPQSFSINETSERQIALLQMQEAETSGYLEGGAKVNTNHRGYSGTGFVDSFYNNPTAKITFQIIGNNGYVNLKLHYSAGGGTCTNIGFYIDDVKIKNLTCPGTGNWDTWGVVTEKVQLSAIRHKVVFKSETKSVYSINIDYIEAVDAAGATPYNGPHNISNGATLQLEDFDNGGEGVAYHDNDASNNGGAYRTGEGVDIQSCSAGGYNVGWTVSGEWLQYTCNVTAGNYDITLYYSTPNSVRYVLTQSNGSSIATFVGPGTGGWQNWQQVTVTNVLLNAGTASVLKLTAALGDFNVDKITFKTSVNPNFPDPNKVYKIATKANANICLNVSGGSFTNSAPIKLATKTDVAYLSIFQEFHFENVGNGYYNILAQNDKPAFAIDMGGNFTNNQTFKILTQDPASANQKFKLVSVGAYYRLESSNSSYSIDNGGNVSAGGTPCLWTSDNNNQNQLWSFTIVQ